MLIECPLLTVSKIPSEKGNTKNGRGVEGGQVDRRETNDAFKFGEASGAGLPGGTINKSPGVLRCVVSRKTASGSSLEVESEILGVGTGRRSELKL